MTDNFIEQSVYLLDLYIVQFVYYPKIIPHVPREAAEQARHVEYFPRPDVVTNRTIRRSIIRALRSYAHRVLNRRNVTQKDVVSYDVWYIQGHDTRARTNACERVSRQQHQSDHSSWQRNFDKIQKKRL